MFCHLSLSVLSLLHSLIVTLLVLSIRIIHKSRCFSLLPLALLFACLTTPHAVHSISIYCRQSLFHMDPLSTVQTKQMCASNPDGVISVLYRDKRRGDRGWGKDPWMMIGKDHKKIGARPACNVMVNKKQKGHSYRNLHNIRQQGG